MPVGTDGATKDQNVVHYVEESFDAASTTTIISIFD